MKINYSSFNSFNYCSIGFRKPAQTLGCLLGAGHVPRAPMAAISHIDSGVKYKNSLKLLYALHFLILLPMWIKVGSEFVRRELGVENALFKKLDLPSAYPWEYVWCLSVVPIILGLLSFNHNKARILRMEYYGQYLFGIVPCCIGIGSLFPELIEYLGNMESPNTPTFNGHFPMVVIWYIFFLIAFQVHIFAIYFTYHLLGCWERDVKKD